MTRDEKLLQYATERQGQVLQAIWEEGGIRAAARALGIDHRAVIKARDAVLAKAALKGYAPEHGLSVPAPEAFGMGKVTVQRDKSGEVVNTWARFLPDAQRQAEAMRAVVEAMADQVKPEKPRKGPRHTRADLVNLYVITDYHLGAYSWHEETGADWNTDLAEQLLVDWFGAAIEQAQDAHTGIFAQLGDFLHFDGINAVTPTSGHLLDADTRFQRVIRVAIRVIRRIVGMLLAKHEHVHLLLAEGNHDISSSMWLRELFAALYGDEPRITVDTRPDPYYCFEHGKTSLYFHHGHRRKNGQLETTLIGKFREIHGRTLHSYAHTGHYHHNKTDEQSTMTIEQHRTLAAPDSHASRGGWLSGRDAKVITYSSEFGEVGRLTVSVDMVKGVAA